MKSIPVAYAYKFASIKCCNFWIPKPFYIFEGAFEVSVPTVKFKLSYLRHFLSEKYFKMATEKKPEIIADVMKKILTGELQNTLPYKEYRMKKLEEKAKKLKVWEENLRRREEAIRTKEKEIANKENPYTGFPVPRKITPFDPFPEQRDWPTNKLVKNTK